MHKPFYASGFLYHPPTQQILLQQSTKVLPNESSFWIMVGGVNEKSETPDYSFRRIMHKSLKVKLHPKSIFPVYDYFRNDNKILNYVFYGEVANIKKIKLPKSGIFSWFSFKQVGKLSLTGQTRQDITVAKRCIDAKSRELGHALINKR